MMGQIPKKTLIQPIKSFGTETTAECTRTASDDHADAYIIISRRAHPDDFLWATCEHEMQIGLKRNINERDFLIDDLNVVEIRRDGNLSDPKVLNISVPDVFLTEKSHHFCTFEGCWKRNTRNDTKNLQPSPKSIAAGITGWPSFACFFLPEPFVWAFCWASFPGS